ncbi:50S ribosomal protein L3 [Candidatus Micrarchaeota archaeon]|nr:50S ribosomal protein L3 [Candidatus Micrarchaeota archaeon]
MGKKGPKRGSRAYWHRSRASSMTPRIRAWSTIGKGMQGFAGYKVGMAHIVMNEYKDNPLKGQEVAKAVTFVLTPPMYVYSIVAYNLTPYGWKIVGEVPATNAPKELLRLRTVAKKTEKTIESIQNAEAFRLLTFTLPHKTGIKKTPEVMEIALGGTAAESLEYAKSVLGKDVSMKDVYKEGEATDVVAVTKGHGWQGVVKRFGVALNTHKSTGARRHGGALGGETQAKVMFTVPRAGQMGFHRRTERNKRILVITEDATEYQPKGGFPHFGNLKGTFAMIEGSLPGPSKRLIRFRKPLQVQSTQKVELKAVVL